MKCTVNVSSDEFPTFWVLHKFSCLLHSVIRGNNNSLRGLACYGPYHLIYTHLPHNVEKRLKLSLKKCSFSPKALRKIHWWTYISPQKMCPASLTTFWYFGYSAASHSVTLVFSPTTFRNSIGNFINGLAGTFHFYSDRAGAMRKSYQNA